MTKKKEEFKESYSEKAEYPNTIYGAHFTSGPGRTWFIDLNESKYGKYLKICLKNKEQRQSVYVPEQKILEFKAHVDEICSILA